MSRLKRDIARRKNAKAAHKKKLKRLRALAKAWNEVMSA